MDSTPWLIAQLVIGNVLLLIMLGSMRVGDLERQGKRLPAIGMFVACLSLFLLAGIALARNLGTWSETQVVLSALGFGALSALTILAGVRVWRFPSSRHGA